MTTIPNDPPKQSVLFHHHKQKLYNVVNNRSHKVVLI
nr:MAG TPA: hypothetical protein [Crassvirales sp.]